MLMKYGHHFFFSTSFNYFLKVWIWLSKLQFSQMQINAWKTYFNDPEAQVTSVEHDDFILVGAIIHDMPQGKQGGRVG